MYGRYNNPCAPVSNMTDETQTLSHWLEALEAYASTLQEYTHSVDEVALRSYPRTRNIYTPALQAAAQELDSARTTHRAPEGGLVALEGSALARAAFALYDVLEQARHSLDTGTLAALHPDLLHTAANRMGRTYSDELRRLASRLKTRREEAKTAAREVPAALELRFAAQIAGGASSAEVASEYASAPGRSVPSAELYAVILETYMRTGENSSRLLQLIDGAAEEALGGHADSPSAIEADAKRRARYHPIQAMGMTFGLHPQEFGSDRKNSELDAALLINSTLPQSHTTVDYDIAPLIDLQTAAKYGPLPADTSGLNFKLVRRLKTIRETPIMVGSRGRGRSDSGAAAPTIRLPEAALGAQTIRQVFQTVDGGRTYRRLDQSGGVPRDIDHVRAGPRGRVARYAELLHEGIRTAPAARLPFEDPEQLLDRYKQDRDRLTETLAPSPERLMKALEVQFLAAHGTALPADRNGFEKLIVSEGYVVKAVSRVLGDTALGTISRAALRRASSSTPVAPPGVTQTEVLLTLTAQAGRIAETLLGRIRGAYAAVAKKRLWRSGREGEADQLALFRDVMRAAVGEKEGVVAKTAAVSPQATLKLFVMG